MTPVLLWRHLALAQHELLRSIIRKNANDIPKQMLEVESSHRVLFHAGQVSEHFFDYDNLNPVRPMERTAPVLELPE